MRKINFNRSRFTLSKIPLKQKHTTRLIKLQSANSSRDTTFFRRLTKTLTLAVVITLLSAYMFVMIPMGTNKLKNSSLTSNSTPLAWTAYVGNPGSNNIVPFNTSTENLGTPISVGNGQRSVAITPNDSTLYICNHAGTISYVNIATGSGSGNIGIGGGSAPYAMAITPKGTAGYIADYGGSKIIPVNTVTNSPGSSIVLSGAPNDVAVTPNGDYVLATVPSSNQVVILSTSTTAILNTVTVPGASGVSIQPNGQVAWIASSSSDSIYPLYLASDTVGTAIQVGKDPQGIAVTPNGQQVLVTNYNSNTVSVISTSTFQVLNTFTVGQNPIAIAVTPDSKMAYVVNSGDGTVMPVVLATDTPQTAFSIGVGIDSIAIDPDQAPVAQLSVTPAPAGSATTFDASHSTVTFGTIVKYVWNFGDGTSQTTTVPTTSHTYLVGGSYLASVTETDSAGTSITRTFTGQTMSQNGGYSAVASQDVYVPTFTTPNWEAYVANSSANTVTPVNVATDVAGSPITVGTDPVALAITPNAFDVLVVNKTSNTVSEIATSNNSVVKTVTLASAPDAIAISPDGTTAWIAEYGANQVVPINLNSMTIGTSISVGTEPDAIAISPDGTTLYVANYNNANVSVIGLTSDEVGSVETTINVGTNPTALSVTPDGRYVLAVNQGSDNVTPIDTRSQLPLTAITVGTSPSAIAISPSGEFAYVTNSSSSNVSIIDIINLTVSSTNSVGVAPSSVAVLPNGSDFFVTDSSASSVYDVNSKTFNSADVNLSSDSNAIAITPDQPPIANLKVTAGAPGSNSSFDASASTVKFGTITSYYFNFGDGTTLLSSTPTVTHAYMSCGTYFATVTETGSGSASNQFVFTGQTASLDGGTEATSTVAVEVPGCPVANWSAYVSNSANNTVTPISVAKNTSGTPFSVGTLPTAEAITPNGNYLLESNQTSNSVDVIDTTTNTVKKSLSIPGGPTFIAITPDGSSAYVIESTASSIASVNLSTLQVGSSISLPGSATGLAITPDNNYLIVSIATLHEILEISLNSLAVVNTITLSSLSDPTNIEVTPNGADAYFTDPTNSTASEINLTDFETVSTISFPTASSPSSLAITPDGQSLFVTESKNSSLAQVSTASNTILNTITLGTNTQPSSVAVTPDSQFAYVADSGTSTVSVISIASASVKTTITTGFSSPSAVAITPDQSPIAHLYTLGAAVIDSPVTLVAPSTVQFGSITTYSWNFGDGSAPQVTSTDQVTHTYSAQGIFIATVTVTDSAGTSTTVTFNGNMVLNNGSNLATASYSVDVNGVYHPISPVRICDTRPANGTSVISNQCDTGSNTTLQAGSVLTVQVTNEANDNVPTGATAAVLNITAISSASSPAGGFITVWPSNDAMPTASTLNFVGGQIVPNLAEIQLSPSGQISIYNFNGSTDILVDVEGWIGPNPSSSTQGSYFNSISPERICDTRPANGTSVISNQCDSGSNGTLSPSTTQNLTVQITGQGGIPTTGVTAVALNLTATDTTAWSFLTVWPSGSEPTASNSNWTTSGQTVANRVIVPVSSNGTINVANFAGTVDVIIDVNGYFSSNSNGATFTGTLPARICDTRSNSGYPYAGQTLGAGSVLKVQVAGRGGVPSMNQAGAPVAAVLNITAANTTQYSFFTVWPDNGTTQPNISDLNWSTGGVVRANLAIVKLGSDGMIDVANAFGSADLIIDVVGWYSLPTTTDSQALSNLSLAQQDANTLYVNDSSSFELTGGSTDTTSDELNQLVSTQADYTAGGLYFTNGQTTSGNSTGPDDISVTAFNCSSTTGTGLPLQNGTGCQAVSMAVFSPSTNSCFYLIINKQTNTENINGFPTSTSGDSGTFYASLQQPPSVTGCSPVSDFPTNWNTTQPTINSVSPAIYMSQALTDAKTAYADNSGQYDSTSYSNLASQLSSIDPTLTFSDGSTSSGNSTTLKQISVTDTLCNSGTGTGTPSQNGTNCQEISLAEFSPTQQMCFYAIVDQEPSTDTSINGWPTASITSTQGTFFATTVGVSSTGSCSPVTDNPSTWQTGSYPY